ncbi:MAG TPA: Uma2 family endonuclease [Blastocatellia bacterium]|nr:Uma2 family endonuclease [Blastocatellia bacterium]HMV85341.1 Uma2 family endonuclease [Blastocatellia bacterium]HMX28734.1 Uma2 family endonuclease [Blastocatellia bacterium]HMY75670.1 Uma2 family endonuclease [Blastocatellia bacterium]HNG29268.1 Uma2 family endonuclease [Blastocatellia bacterium]
MSAVVEIQAGVGAKPKYVADEPATKRQFTVEEYRRMIAAGVFDEDERVELIEGEVLQMAAKSLRHVAGVRRVTKVLGKSLGKAVFISAQDPIQLGDISEPEPDVVVAKPSSTDYEDHHPTPEEIFLIVEVAETSLNVDRKRKLPLYAQAGIQQFCILNLRDEEVEDYRDPASEGYRNKQTYKASQSFNLVAFPKIKINVADLIPQTFTPEQLFQGSRPKG